jgi:hypothetical protein
MALDEKRLQVAVVLSAAFTEWHSVIDFKLTLCADPIASALASEAVTQFDPEVALLEGFPTHALRG